VENEIAVQVFNPHMNTFLKLFYDSTNVENPI